MTTPPLTDPPPARKRIAFTGGSGIVGRHVISSLLSAGHEILNLDITPLANPAVHTVKTDITVGSQVFNALSSPFSLTPPIPSPTLVPDALVHFAAIPRILIVPDDELFRVNVMGTYNAIEAAAKLGIKKIVFASSVTVYGVTYGYGRVEYPSFPCDEEVDVNPMDTYAISKMCGERIARGFARRFGIDVYVLRLGAVVAPDEYRTEIRRFVEEPERGRMVGWSYTDVRDLGKIVDMCIRRDGLGYQVFNATNDRVTSMTRTEELLRRECPGTRFTRGMGEWEAPFTNAKIKKTLGFEEAHDWRTYWLPAGGEERREEEEECGHLVQRRHQAEAELCWDVSG